MARIRRNALCPCGSGKKYKKCCLAKDKASRPTTRRAEERRARRAAPDQASRVPLRVDGGREAERRQRLHRLCHQLVQSLTKPFNGWSDRRRALLLENVADAWGVDLELCDGSDFELLSALVFFENRIASADHRTLRRQVEGSLRDPKQRQLLALLQRTPIQAWCAHADKSGVVYEGHPVMGPDSRRVRLLNGVLRNGLVLPEGVYAGWPLPFDGGRYLTFASPLWPGGLTELETLADTLNPVDFHDFWTSVQDEVVAAALGFEFQPNALAQDDPRAPDKLDIRVVDDALRPQLLSRLEDLSDPPLRHQVARALTPAAMNAVLSRVGSCREWLLRPFATLLGDEAKHVMSLPSLLEYYGVTPDGAVIAETFEAVRRAPVEILGLEPRILARAAIDPLLPVIRALAWAETNANHPSAAPLRAAWAIYLIEQRWVFTLEASRRFHQGRREWSYYDDLMAGFRNLFDDAIFETRLSESGLGTGALRRLDQGSGERPLVTVGDLPMSVDSLFRLPGVGKKTIDDLTAALFETARTWRRSRVPIDEVRLQAMIEPGARADADLSDGLGELAALFGS